jgi:hypothetical protein
MDEEEDIRAPRFAIADMTVIGLALAFGIGGLYLIFGPSPLAPLMEIRKQAEQADTAAAAAEEARAEDSQPTKSEPGEVNIDLKNYKAPPQH